MRSQAYELNFLHEESHWWFLARREIITQLLRHYLVLYEFPSDIRILDFGCGTGLLTQALAQFGHVTGVDFHPEAIAYCEKRGLSRVHRIKSSMQIESHAYHLLTAFDVLEHVEDDRALLDEWWRMLTPGGLLLITVPALPWLWGGEDVVSEHKRRYYRSELREKMREAGFELHRITYFNTILFPLILPIRLFNRFFRPSTLHRSDLKRVWPPLNVIICRFFGLERKVLAYIDFPIGASLLALAQKPWD